MTVSKVTAHIVYDTLILQQALRIASGNQKLA